MSATAAQKQSTLTVMQRIAQLKIDAYGLPDTVDEYVEKAKKETALHRHIDQK